jgi:large conductance mechanosensitive channel
MGLLQEFKEFAVKGNAVDMAVGIIIGAAFGKVVTSMVNDIIMPPIGLIIGGVEFKDLAIVLQKAVVTEAGEITTPEVAIKYGAFINTTIDFLIVAFTIFIVIKYMNRMMKKREPAPTPTA